MTTGEFDTLMNIVYSRWTVKSYPEVVRNRIWFFVKDLPQKSFEKIIYALLDASRAAPMPNEFKLLAYGEKDRLGIGRARDPETKPYKEAKCFDCGDSGNLWVTRREQFEPWAKWERGVIRCYCEIGRSRPQVQGPIWNQAIEKSYEKHSVYSDTTGWGKEPKPSQIQAVQNLAQASAKEHRSGSLRSVKNILNNTDGPEGAA